MQFYGNDGFPGLPVEIPLLYYFLILFKFQVLSHDAAFPHGKFGTGDGRHFGFLARPQLDGDRVGKRHVKLLGRSRYDVVFFKIFHGRNLERNDRISGFKDLTGFTVTIIPSSVKTDGNEGG
jgi:hypothetical protein